jgi:predicted porin
MKTVISKTLGAAVVAGASLGAHAEGVSFYGLLDAGYATTSISGATTATTTEFVTGGYAPNFIGTTGTKDLGKGLTAGFNLEQGFLLNSPSSGSSRFNFGSGDALFNRQANLFIKGGFGEVKAGTQGNVAFDSVLLGDARFGSDFGSSLAAIVIDGGMSTADSGTLAYSSPTMYGLTAKYQYIPQDNVPSSSKTTGTRGGTRASLSYEAGPFKASLAAYSTDKVDETVTRKGTVAAATYKIGPVDLKALYTMQKTATYGSLKTVGVGGAYFVTADLTLDFGVFKTTDGATDYQNLATGIGAQYALAKGVTAYFQYANVKNTGATSVAYNFLGDTQAGFFITSGQTASTYNVGMLYSF